MSRIAVVIPTFNRAHLIAATLDSVLAQGPHVRVLVMDDGSTDGTGDVVARYVASGRVYFEWAPNTGGPVRPRNRGFRQVDTPYTAFFDADDLMCEGYIDRALRLFDAHPHWVALASDYRNFDSSGDAPQSHLQTCPRLQMALGAAGGQGALELGRRDARLILVRENFALTSSVLYRTDALQTLGGFDESLRFSEDFDLLWRATGLGTIGVSTDLSFRRRIHNGNVSHQTRVILSDKVRSRERLLAAESDPDVRRELQAALARFTSALAVETMRFDRRSALRTWWRALQVGAPVDEWPRGLVRALAKSYLRPGG